MAVMPDERARQRLYRRLHMIRHWLLDLHDAGTMGPLAWTWLREVEAKLDALDEPEIERLRAEMQKFHKRCDAIEARIRLALARRA